MPHWIDFIPLALCVVASGVDLIKREIPDSVSLLILALVPARIWLLSPQFAIWHSLLGGSLAFAIGFVLARNDGFGGGDVKLVTALGFWFGCFALFPLGLWIALAGLPLAIIAAIRGEKDFAYGPAILAGTGIHAMAPQLLQGIAGLQM